MKAITILLPLGAATAVGETVHVLPRSHADLDVRAAVECVDPDGCALEHLCLAPDEWTSGDPASFEFLETLDHGALAWTPYTADDGLACVVRVEGAANVAGELAHRDAYGDHYARETVALSRLRSVAGELENPDVPLAGRTGCRPATWSGYCADAVHLPAADCPNREPAWHAYVEDRFDGERDEDGTMVPRAEIPEGELVRFAGKARMPSDWRGGAKYHWRIVHGAWNDDTWTNMRPNQDIQYRAPWVAADATETVTLTVEARGYCATTTIKFTVLDNE